MEITLCETTGDDRDAVIGFMTSNAPWPFHVRRVPTPEQAGSSWDAGAYTGPECRSGWIAQTGRPIGLCTFSDIGDDTATLDLRLATASRGHGIGVQALRSATDWFFWNVAAPVRLEGNTRVDNVAMRKTFRRAGFVKEAHYRQAWPVPAECGHRDAVAYAMLRTDWESGTTTPVAFGDEP